MLKYKIIIPALLFALLLSTFGCSQKQSNDYPQQSDYPKQNVTQSNTVEDKAIPNTTQSGEKTTTKDTQSDTIKESTPPTVSPKTEISHLKESTPNKSATGLSNTKRGWGLKLNSNHKQPEMPSSISATLNKYGSYWIGKPDEKVVYLTFDEGYEKGYSGRILDVLKDNNVKAAFFVTGYYLKSQPDLVKRMSNEGHIIGNHTDSHPSMPDFSDEQIKKELQVVEKRYEEITGRKDMKYLRPPKGEYSERTLAESKALGYHSIFWSMALVDWIPMKGGPQEAYQHVMDNLHNGALILLHAVSQDDTEALDRILKDIKTQGYTFKTLDDLVK